MRGPDCQRTLRRQNIGHGLVHFLERVREKDLHRLRRNHLVIFVYAKGHSAASASGRSALRRARPIALNGRIRQRLEYDTLNCASVAKPKFVRSRKVVEKSIRS